MKRFFLIILALGVMVLLFGSCTHKGKTYLIINSLNPASEPFGDVMTSNGVIPPDTVDVELLNSLQNAAGLESTAYADIVLESVTIGYTRVDGGSGVPPTFRSAISYRIPANGTLTIDNLTAVPATFKQKFPISDLIYYGYERSTNYTSIRCDMKLEFYGHTVAGDPVYVVGSITIEFANFADNN